MTREDINKKAYEKYPVAMDQRSDSLGFGDFNAPPRQGYIEAYKEISSLPTIKGCVARNRFGGLGIFHGEEVPRKDKENGFWYVLGEDYSDPTLFPDLRWDDEPIKVELLIIRK